MDTKSPVYELLRDAIHHFPVSMQGRVTELVERAFVAGQASLNWAAQQQASLARQGELNQQLAQQVSGQQALAVQALTDEWGPSDPEVA